MIACARYLIALAVMIAAACATRGDYPRYATTIEPLPGENFLEPCKFEMSLPASDKTVKAVWITYDRGYDITRFYDDPDVVAFAQRNGIALMLARQCPAKDPPTHENGEMDMDPSRGMARSVFAALADLSAQSHHPEISSAKLIGLGFSGIGVLFANFVEYAPDRIVAAVLANSGQSDPFGIDHVPVSAAGAMVPEMIIAGGADVVGGTNRNFGYFTKRRKAGSPSVLVIQNKIPHCCVINAKALILDWLSEMIRLREPAAERPLRTVATTAGWVGMVLPCDDRGKDDLGEPLWNACGTLVRDSNTGAPAGYLDAGWFPTRALAEEWKAFVDLREHPATSFPNQPK